MIILTLIVQGVAGFMVFSHLHSHETWTPYLTFILLGDLAYLVLMQARIAEDVRAFKSHPKIWLKVQWKEWGEPFLVAAVLALLIRTFLLGPYKIPTGSMKPTFMEHDRIFVDKLSYHFREPERGDIIVFKYPVNKKKDFVKRLAGLPGDHLQIRDGKLIVNGEEMNESPFADHYYYNRPDWLYSKEGQEIVVPEGHYFALGDNSAQSSDSRNWGFIPKENLIGKTLCIWWPPDRIKIAR